MAQPTHQHNPPSRSDFVRLLRISAAHTTKGKVSAHLLDRLVALGHAHACPRCKGSGRFGQARSAADACFRCQGTGFKSPQLTQQLFVRIQADVLAGRLDAVLANRRLVIDAWRQNREQHISGQAGDYVDAAPTAITQDFVLQRPVGASRL